MNSVKVVMGFLELAAAMKFISNVDLVYQWGFLTRPVFISVWLAIALVTSVYLMGFFRFPHESASESTGALRVIFAVFFYRGHSLSFPGIAGVPPWGAGRLSAAEGLWPGRGHGIPGGQI